MTLPEEQLGIRLVNGSSRCSGFVQVLLESWEPVCAGHWNRAATEAACNALGCGDLGNFTHLAPPTSERPPGATSRNTSSSRNTTWAGAPTVRCHGANWQLCKVEDYECSSDRRLVWVTCAGTSACPYLPYTLGFKHCSQTSRLPPRQLPKSCKLKCSM